MNLSQVRDLSEGLGVTEGNVADAMVSEGGDAVDDGGFLSSSRSSSGDEDPSVLPVQSTSTPLTTSGVPECLSNNAILKRLLANREKGKQTYLPLCWEVTVTSGDTEQVCVEGGELLGGDDFVIGFRRGVHLGQDFLRECLGDSMGDETQSRSVG